MAGNPFTYFSYDLLTGRLMGSTPMRATQFGQTLNSPSTANMTLDLRDPRVQSTNPLACTVPNRTLVAIDYNGVIVWAGIVMTRRRGATASGYALNIQCAEIWTYFQQRVQATDYSAPPSSGIDPSGMSLWTATPWDASLTACQVISDAIGYADGASMPYGNLLGGMGLLLNGATPSASTPPSPPADWIAINYPFASAQMVDSIVSQICQLGLGVGPDIGVDVAYSAGMGSSPVATINLSYPRRGRTVSQGQLMIDYTTAREYEFPEDGTQTANQVFEIGGGGAIVVDQNVFPLDQGYPLWERVISRATAQSQNIVSLLGQLGVSDLAMYSYAPVAPTVKLALNDPNLPLGSFMTGDDVEVVIPALAADGSVFDPGFPAGLNQEWRIIDWQVDLPDEGDATMTLTLNQPPYLQALAPAV